MGYCEFCRTQLEASESSGPSVSDEGHAYLARRLDEVRESGAAAQDLGGTLPFTWPWVLGYTGAAVIALLTLGLLIEMKWSLDRGDLGRAVVMLLFAGGFGYAAWRLFDSARQLQTAPVVRQLAAIASYDALPSQGVPQAMVTLQLDDGTRIERLVTWYSAVRPIAVGSAGVADVTEGVLRGYRTYALPERDADDWPRSHSFN